MDSSSYAKLFIAEAGTEAMIELFTRSRDHALFVSILAAVEVRSALHRRQVAGDIRLDSATRAIFNLVRETKRILQQPITALVVTEANSLIDRHGLRSLDAIQLASAVIARSNLGQSNALTFVASDHKLLKAAQVEAFQTWDPAVPNPS